MGGVCVMLGYRGVVCVFGCDVRVQGWVCVCGVRV